MKRGINLFFWERKVMNRFLFVSLLALAVTTAPAFASCEDGEMMASAAAKKAAAKVAPNCRLAKISEPSDTARGQDFWVSLRCSTQTLNYKVSLQEVEDAVCFVKKVTRVKSSEPVLGPANCPPAGRTINCMPVTTNPLCKPETRKWIRNNCPSVHFLG